jgi:arsenite methyltransferase
MDTKEINIRYSELATLDCCLSCGSAVNLSAPRTGEICVDLGSGKGTDAIRLAEKVGPDGFVYGVDISDGMISASVKMANRLGVKNVLFIQSDLESITIPSETANLIISNCTINHVSNKHAVWNEIFRILKKGGRFVISDIYSTKEVPEEFRNDPVAIAECWAGAITKDRYLATIVEAGFMSTRMLEESSPYPKGKTEVVSFTIAGEKAGTCTCGN